MFFIMISFVFCTVFSGVCGSDGRTYRNIDILKCVQGTEYGKQVNLQLSHEGTCFGELTWQQINLTILPFVIVSRLKIDSTLIEHHFIFV